VIGDDEVALIYSPIDTPAGERPLALGHDGALPLAMVDVASALAQVKAGRLKALAVTSRTRVSAWSTSAVIQDRMVAEALPMALVRRA